MFPGSMGCFICTFVLCVEIVSDRFKTAIGILIEVPFAVGEVIVAALGIGIKDWRNLQVKERKAKPSSYLVRLRT